MTFNEVLTQVLEQLRREGRVSYRALKRQFALDDEYLEDLKAEIIEAKRLAIDEEGKVLVWVGDASVASSQLSVTSSSQPPAAQTADSGLRTPDLKPQTLDTRRSDGERRQLTVMFCDLVGSTALSTQLDPEELREVVQAYQDACAAVINRYGGHIAQYLGDGLLVYFGYPVAHEDDAARAVRAGLEIVGAIHELPLPLEQQAQLPQSLQLRIGIHTGPVVVGEIGGGGRRERLALGETPNIAARVQGLAAPDEVVISFAPYQLVQGLFEGQDLGPQQVRGIATPLVLYRVLRESGVQSRFEVAVTRGLTPLVGRTEELALLRRHWERAKDGEGQVVLLSGEPGIGKSRLVQEVKEIVATEGATRIEFRCSPYAQSSAFFPIIEHLQRFLQFDRDDTVAAKLAKLQHTLATYRFPQSDTVPLLAALLSLPHPADFLPLNFSPQRQKQRTQEALMSWLAEEAERNPVCCPWEDVHWADPSTLELLNLLIDQVPTARLYLLLTFRPEFTLPWGMRSHISQLTLSRLSRVQVGEMVGKVTGGKALPIEVLQQIIAKTDGVPLFVEELTKMVVESDLYVSATGRSPLPLGIPATLHGALMARLDRLNTAKEIAQLGAALGREFNFELLKAVSPLDEGSLQQGLTQLVAAELVYQRGLPPQARYIFKHALIQDAAYESLLKSKRQQYHQQIAQALERRFPDIAETQPELLAHHYTEAGLIEQAIPYWQQAGQLAAQRSANAEAINHLTKGLALLEALPDTRERAQRELALQVTLGSVLMAAKGYAAPEVERTYSRVYLLCQQVGETPLLSSALLGLWAFYLCRAEHRRALELGEELLSLAHSQHDRTALLWGHRIVGESLVFLGKLVLAREHIEQGMRLFSSEQVSPAATFYFQDHWLDCFSRVAHVLWRLGYPD
ncbi:MAG TPA: adenylate/guanylate cyclase domain-containing protein, partial [Candidatus Binatia bacterium]|nr:adenylate/guanylate cyclase domain-containing protein [Candidatus Binatia bacterium]